MRRRTFVTALGAAASASLAPAAARAANPTNSLTPTGRVDEAASAHLVRPDATAGNGFGSGGFGSGPFGG